MKLTRTNSVIKRLVAGALAAMFLVSCSATAFAGKTLAESTNFQEQIKLDDVLYNYNYYSDYLVKNKNTFSDVKNAVIDIDVNNYTAFEGEEPKTENLEGKDNVLNVSIDNESISWEIEVEKAGYYQLNIEYYPIAGNSLPISRGIQIDGKYLYDELSNVRFVRHWVDAAAPRVNNLGDQVRPSQEEKKEWITTPVYDALGEYSAPLKVGLKAGKHTIKMVFIDQPIVISSLSLGAPESLKSYAEVKAEWDKKGYKPATQTILFNAEDVKHITYKTESSITIASSSDPTLLPKSIEHEGKTYKGITSKIYNHIGASSWGTGGQEIEWKFTVPESGLYTLAPRYYQGYGNGLSSTRQIKIDGEVPFAEFSEMVFTFKEQWMTKPFADKDGNPYAIYLEKGEHTISMRCVSGQMTEAIHVINDITSKLSNTVRNITMITGQSPDLNYDYRLERQIPSLMGDLKDIVNELKQCNEIVGNFAVKKTPIENNFTMSYELLEEMIDRPNKIPAKLADMSSALTNIGTWLSEIKQQQFALDYIQFVPYGEEVKNEKSSVFDTLYSMIANFILSYQKDYNAIGAFGEGNENYPTIKVWISKGKEICEILKELTDSDFSVKHKINVDLNILPAGALGGGTSPLLLAINAGTQPDAVIGIGNAVPVDYAIRNAMYDLSQFDDFDEFKKYTLDECFVPLTYEGGIYGLPEGMGFNVMFYRTDIFEQLDMKVPKSWTEVVDVLLPQLYSYNMQFWMPGETDMFVYQEGAEYYSDTRYTSLVDSPEFMKGFETMIKFYTDYGCPISASFLNRFRSGEMPIGLGGMDMYLQLVYAAPELAGKWKMVPLPGTVQPDGSIKYCSGNLAGSCSAILATDDKERAENAWTYLKWFVSADTQVAYCRQIESILGVQARVGTSNIEAFNQLPWTAEEREVIQISFDTAKEVPAALGGYYTGRHLTNAKNRCLISGQSVREALEEASEEINKELRRKQKMYGVNPDGLY